MRRFAKRAMAALLLFGLGVYLFNAPWRGAAMHGQPRLLAHRGVHQTFDLEGVGNDTCTATRIREPIAPEIENTIGSMRAAFDLGAEVVELDVHPTTDGQFAVFHDWTLDCRTDGSGAIRDHDMAYLRSLDIGYGYTADGGRTFPLRGRGSGLMPSFADVMAAFPDGRFLVNFKSNDAHEGDMLADMLAIHPQWRDMVWAVYGGDRPTVRALERLPGLRGYSLQSVRSCLVSYLALGWTGHVPDACRNTVIPLPINVAPWLWGWPDLFIERMRAAGSEVILRGPYRRGRPTGGIDSAEDAARVPQGYDGYVWTNEIGLAASLFLPEPAID